jgi:hypothetical protein
MQVVGTPTLVPVLVFRAQMLLYSVYAVFQNLWLQLMRDGGMHCSVGNHALGSRQVEGTRLMLSGSVGATVLSVRLLTSELHWRAQLQSSAVQQHT